MEQRGRGCRRQHIIPFDDVDPPRFNAVGLSIDGDMDDGIAYIETSFVESAAVFASANRIFLDSLGPPGFNLSFPVAPPLEDNFTVGETSTIVALPFDYSFEVFAALHEASASVFCKWGTSGSYCWSPITTFAVFPACA